MFQDDLPPVPFADEQMLRETINVNSNISGFVPQAPTVTRGNGVANNRNSYINRTTSDRNYGAGVYSGLLGSGYTLKGNHARFLLPQTDNLSPAAAISGKLDNWPANGSTNITGASKAFRPSIKNSKQNTRKISSQKNKNKKTSTFVHNINKKNDMNNIKETQARNSAAKPQFLKEIEFFVESELTLLGLKKDDGEASAARLQVFREAFQCIIDDFKTYRPILSAIKNEYDMLLDKYAKRLHYIPPLQARLQTIQADVERRISRLTKDQDKERTRMEKKISTVAESNKNLKSLNESLADDNLKLTKELDIQRAKYLDMKTANLSLVASVKHKDETIADEALKLGNQIDRAKYLGLQVEQTQMKYDSAMAKMKKLRITIAELQSQAKVPEITPAQMLAVQKELKKTRDDLDKGGKAFKKLQKDNTKLTLAIEELSAKKKELEYKLQTYENQNIQVFASKTIAERMKQANVILPSPIENHDTDIYNNDSLDDRNQDNSPFALKDCLMSCLHHIDGLGLSVDEGMNENRTAEMVTIRGFEKENLKAPKQEDMFQHLDPENDAIEIRASLVTSEEIKQAGNTNDAQRAKEKYAYFTGLGIGEDVPLYLRVNGRVRNLYLSKPEVERFIKTCWIQKGRKRYTKSLEEFMHVMLCEMHPKRLDDRLSFAYSFKEAVAKYSYDADCDLFNEVLHGRLPEDVYLSQMRLIRKLQEAFIKEDRKDGEQTGTLRKSQIMEIVRHACPHKDKRKIKELEQALFFDTQLHNINYIKLFQEDEEGDQGKFVECLRDQYLEECTVFVEDIVEAMGVLKSSARNSGKAITIHEIRQTLTAIAPNKTTKSIEKYIRRGLGDLTDVDAGFGIDIDPVAMNSNITPGMDGTTEVDIDLFLVKLRQGNKRTNVKKAAWNCNVKVNEKSNKSNNQDMADIFSSLSKDEEMKNLSQQDLAPTKPQSTYHRLRICISHVGSTISTPQKAEQKDGEIDGDSKKENLEHFRSSHTFLSLPDPSMCANEMVKLQKEDAGKEISQMKHSHSSPSRMMTTIWRHGMMVGLTETKNEKHMFKHKYRRLPSKGKLLMRMTLSASAFRKWKSEMWHTRYNETKLIMKIQACVRKFLLSKRVKQRYAAKVIKRNLFLAKLVIKCKKRASNANIVRIFCKEATQQGKFNVIIKKYRWAVITCQRWCKQWILAKRERMKILGKLFDKRVKYEFKVARKKFDRYVDQVVKTSDVRTALKEVADIREQWAIKHMRANLVLRKRRRSSRAFRTKNEILSNIPKFESIIDAPRNEADEGVLLRKRLAALQYLRDDYKKGYGIRKDLLETILRKYRGKHAIKLAKFTFEKKIKSQLQRKVDVHDVKKFIQSDSMHLDGDDTDEDMENISQNLMIHHKKKHKKIKRKPGYPNIALQQTLLIFKKAKEKDVPRALEEAIKTILSNEKIVLYF
eukprot:g1699.t1